MKVSESLLELSNERARKVSWLTLIYRWRPFGLLLAAGHRGLLAPSSDEIGNLAIFVGTICILCNCSEHLRKWFRRDVIDGSIEDIGAWTTKNCLTGSRNYIPHQVTNWLFFLFVWLWFASSVNWIAHILTVDGAVGTWACSKTESPWETFSRPQRRASLAETVSVNWRLVWSGCCCTCQQLLIELTTFQASQPPTGASDNHNLTSSIIFRAIAHFSVYLTFLVVTFAWPIFNKITWNDTIFNHLLNNFIICLLSWTLYRETEI